ncbi:hypothetical protein Tco_0876032 [Tanacetum coccineum]|uniref:Uncharacterized protein n=1 Tax=Tanacetum coccineum TaxID=301880 RepID=A0ABQ5BTZ3_9ASTR
MAVEEGGGDEGVEVVVTRWIWVEGGVRPLGQPWCCVVMLVVSKVGNGVDDDDVDEVEMVDGVSWPEVGDEVALVVHGSGVIDR